MCCSDGFGRPGAREGGAPGGLRARGARYSPGPSAGLVSSRPSAHDRADRLGGRGDPERRSRPRQPAVGRPRRQVELSRCPAQGLPRGEDPEQRHLLSTGPSRRRSSYSRSRTWRGAVARMTTESPSSAARSAAAAVGSSATATTRHVVVSWPPGADNRATAGGSTAMKARGRWRLMPSGARSRAETRSRIVTRRQEVPSTGGSSIETRASALRASHTMVVSEARTTRTTNVRGPSNLPRG